MGSGTNPTMDWRTKGALPTMETQVKQNAPAFLVHPIYSVALSSRYRQQQHHLMSQFGSQDGPQLFKTFTNMATTKQWAKSTQASYWIALMSARSQHGIQSSHADKTVTRWLTAQAKSATPVYRIPSMQQHHAKEIWDTYRNDALPILISFLLGQRLGDVLKLHGENVQKRSGGGVTLTFRRGKVVPKIGPFVIFMAKSPVSHALIVLCSKIKPESELFKCGPQYSKILREYKLEMRSPRRGGLQLMASQGASLEQLLSFSMHASVSMLRKYLNHGADVEALASTQLAITGTMF